jgi:hypothetical protein
MNKCLFAFAGFVLFLIAAPVAGQQPSPPRGTPAKAKQAELQKEKEDVVRISVTLVQVDAVVTDAKGRYITDLKPEDFELRTRYGVL